MFFKRAKQDPINPPPETPAPVEDALAGEGAAVEAEGIPPLPAHELRRVTDPKSLGFETTADIEPARGLVGQERALAAIAFGAAIRARDFNIFVLGPPGAGKTAAVTAYLLDKAASVSAPPDWAYVHNFAEPNRPKALALPPGRAAILAKCMDETIDELRTILPMAFEAEHYHIGRRAIEEEFLAGHDDALEALKARAQAQGVAILRTPAGFGMAPTHEGKIVKSEVYQQLPEKMRQDVSARVDALQSELQEVLAQMPVAERLRRTRLRELDEDIAGQTVAAALEDVEAAFADLPDVLAFLGAAKADLIRNASLFRGKGGDDALVKQPPDASRDRRFRRYSVNVLVSRGGEAEGAPVHEEINPTYGSVIGRVEHIADASGSFTDFLLIKPGALHQANGGYLLIDARKILLSPVAWEALKRTMKAGAIRVEPPMENAGPLAAQTLDAEPIPLDVKVFLIGEAELYDRLSQEDPDFRRLFQVQADFEESIPRKRESEAAFARLAASIAAVHNLLPIDAAGVARLIDESARMAGDRERLSVTVGRIADLARRANHWAEEAAREVTTRADVARAIDEENRRASRVRDRARETMGRDAVLTGASGARIGQVNGLCLAESAGAAFGRPSRITARVRFGSGRATGIEREAELGGTPRSKGVTILWGYLAGRYARDIPLALAATLVFEHSHGGLDGGGASCAELFALLSALAETPIRQGVAVTGSIDQLGETQASDGVNEKIEGFFDICQARGLTGDQGVIIPRANARHLMLREDIVEAARRGLFHVWGIAAADEGMELLTGVAAGAEDAGGNYPANTNNRRIADRLRLFAERAKEQGRPLASAEKDDDYYDRARRRGR